MATTLNIWATEAGPKEFSLPDALPAFLTPRLLKVLLDNKLHHVLSTLPLMVVVPHFQQVFLLLLLFQQISLWLTATFQISFACFFYFQLGRWSHEADCRMRRILNAE